MTDATSNTVKLVLSDPEIKRLKEALAARFKFSAILWIDDASDIKVDCKMAQYFGSTRTIRV